MSYCPRRPSVGLLSTAVFLLASLGTNLGRPAWAQTDEEQPAPHRSGLGLQLYQPLPPPDKPLLGLAIGGAATLGATWGLSILPAAICDLWNLHFYKGTTRADGTPKCDTWPLYIPVLGPWLTLGVAHANAKPDAFVDGLLVFDGLAQAAGLAMIIGGAVGRTRGAAFSQNDLRIVPLTLARGSGVLVSGRF